MANVTILGSGGWGTALAVTCAKRGHNVTLWSAFREEIETIERDGENKALLAGVKLPQGINYSSNFDSLPDADLIVLAVPSFAIRETCRKICPHIRPNVVITNVAKGIENSSFKRLSQVIEEELPQSRVVVLSGPSHAEEVARGIPSMVVSASASESAAQYVQDALMSNSFRIYTVTDIIGVEIGGALKNVIALAAGVSDGLGLGDNTKAALMTRGIAEISRLGVALGAQQQTFLGLSGIGDLIVTCTSMHSRNRRFGILIGKGKSVEAALDDIGMTVEGYHATKVAYEIAQKNGVEMPIVECAYRVLYEKFTPSEAIVALMERPKRSEHDFSEE